MLLYGRAVWLRLVASVSRVAIVIAWSPTMAAAPNLTGAHPASTKPAPSTTADVVTSLRSTAPRLLTPCLLMPTFLIRVLLTPRLSRVPTG
jgi:hypothetical protein